MKNLKEVHFISNQRYVMLFSLQYVSTTCFASANILRIKIRSKLKLIWFKIDIYFCMQVFVAQMIKNLPSPAVATVQNVI